MDIFEIKNDMIFILPLISNKIQLKISIIQILTHNTMEKYALKPYPTSRNGFFRDSDRLEGAYSRETGFEPPSGFPEFLQKSGIP